MNQSERLAERYLRSLGFNGVTYEPDGNVPPDFVVDGKVAVEVRRLNQFKQSPNGDMIPVEEVSEPVPKRIETCLKRLGPSVDGESWFVHVCLSRPFESWKVVRRKLPSTLNSFKSSQARRPCTLSITPHLDLDLKRAPTPQQDFFLLGGLLDYDSGGFTLAETIRSLSVIIPEKEAKVAPYRMRYPKWWLVLINHTIYRLNEEDLSAIRNSPPVEHSFDKVVLVNPLDTSNGTEI